jgi:hypothetical protein
MKLILLEHNFRNNYWRFTKKEPQRVAINSNIHTQQRVFLAVGQRK